MARSSALLFGLLSALISTACSGASTSTNVSAPSTTRCQPTVTPSATTYSSAGGTGSLNVSVARECTWSASSETSWIALTSAREGQGDGSIAYRIDTNAEPVTRRGAVSVEGVPVQLSQDAAPCRFQVAAANEPVPPIGGERSVTVRTHAACGWTAVSAVPWATVAPPSGRGDGAVRVMFGANDGATRSGEISVAGERIALMQLAGGPPAPAPAPPPSPAPPPAPPPPAPAPPSPAPAPPPPTPGGEIELEGHIVNVSGSCPLLTFALSGRTVWTTSDTDFKRGSCRDIRSGIEVEVDGRRMSDGTVRADEIEIKKKD